MLLESLAAPEDRSGTLIQQGAWDAYDLESVLALKDAYRETTTLGFLLRHYWVPATTLRFRQSCRSTSPDGTTTQQESLFERVLVRCHSSECIWRERSVPIDAGKATGSDTLIERRGDIVCRYNCHEQTFRTSTPVSREPPMPADATEAKRKALYRLPMLAPPPGPVLIGFEWRGEVEDDHMHYQLEAEKQFKGTSVLVIRRKGRFTSAAMCREAVGLPSGVPTITERQGVTLFAWKRGAVLEDRYLDRVLERRPGSPGGQTTLVVTRLVGSRPVVE